jgi:hypothetical protein
MAAAQAQESGRVALVLGNAAYRFGPPLANPHTDAEAIAATLRRLGFALIILHKDLGRIELGRALSDFQVRADNSDMAVVYFAGHGLEIDGQNYLVPVDAELQHVGSMRFEAIALSDVLPVVHGAKTLQLVILDACRDNPFLGRMRGLGGTRSVGLGLSNIEPGGNTLVAYAAKHGTKALDGPVGTNSPYAEALLQHLETPDLEIRLLFGKVRDTVLQQTHNAQEPHLYGSLGGEEIYLRPSRSPHEQPDYAEAEAAWREFDLDHTSNSEIIEAWLAQFGSRAAFHAHKARLRLVEIAEQRRRQDATDWQAARAEDTLVAYERYLGAWPAGVGAVAASERGAALRDDAAWQRAAAAATIEALGQYLEAWPDGRHAEEATAKSLALTAERVQATAIALTEEPLDPQPWPLPPPKPDEPPIMEWLKQRDEEAAATPGPAPKPVPPKPAASDKPVPPKPAQSGGGKQGASWGFGVYWAAAVIFWIATGHFNFWWPLEGVGLALKAFGVDPPYMFQATTVAHSSLGSSDNWKSLLHDYNSSTLNSNSSLYPKSMNYDFAKPSQK